jgi:hypothetical protein
MTVTKIKSKKPITIKLECSACGAAGTASCNCGVAYETAGSRAAKALAADPARSDRAIAKEIGIDHKTVAKARGDNSPPEKRVGQDSKSYPAKPKRQAVDPRTVSLMHKSTKAFQMAPPFEAWDEIVVDAALIELVKQTATCWTKLAEHLEAKLVAAPVGLEAA